MVYSRWLAQYDTDRCVSCLNFLTIRYPIVSITAVISLPISTVSERFTTPIGVSLVSFGVNMFLSPKHAF